MPDTGAPWNIPYADPTDLVRDWPALSEDVAERVANGLTFGLGTNVYQTVKLDTFSTTSTSFTDVTGLTQTVTPLSASSKFLVIADVKLGMNPAAEGDAGHLRINGGGADAYVGASAGNRVRGAGWTGAHVSAVASAITYMVRHVSVVYLATPGVGTAVTFAVQARRGPASGTLYVNRSGADTDNASYARLASSITVIEVAA